MKSLTSYAPPSSGWRSALRPLPAFAGAADYAFEPVKVDVKNGAGSELAVRLVHKPTGKPVEGAVLFRTRLDMSPDSMGEMTAKHVAMPATEPGVYRFKADLTMAGGWAFKHHGQGAGRGRDRAGHRRLQGQGLRSRPCASSSSGGSPSRRSSPRSLPATVSGPARGRPRAPRVNASRRCDRRRRRSHRERKVLYWKDPDGEHDFSPTPKKTADGRDYLPVYDDQEADFAAAAAEAPPQRPRAAPRKLLYYRNPMGLADTSPVPKKDWMGMDYIPVYEGEEQDGSTVKVSLDKCSARACAPRPPRCAGSMRPVRAPGVAKPDERTLRVVTLRADGFIEKLYVNETGRHVKAGEPLFRVYSPQMVAVQVDYRNADHRTAGIRDERGALQRLRTSQCPKPCIDELLKRTREPIISFDWPSPVSGVVMQKKVDRRPDGEGRRGAVPPRRSLQHLGHRRCRRAGHRPGQGRRAGARSRSAPFRARSSTAASPSSCTSWRWRRAPPRCASRSKNPDHRIKHEMFADVEIDAGAGDGERLVVPVSAVIDSGNRQVVLVERGEGRFEPRAVKLGMRGDGFVEITEGVKAGEQVVVTANFLIDAESNLKAALQAFTAEPATTEASIGGQAMIARLIRWSADNLMLILIGDGARDRRRPLCRRATCRSMPFPISPTRRSSSTPSIPGRRRRWSRIRSPIRCRPPCCRCRARRWCAASRSSACRSSTSSSRKAPTSTGRAPACSNISRPPPAICRAGVTPTLGPDATGVGWVYQYAVMAAKRTLAELRTTQDWQVRFAVAKAEGVAEVASVGGFVRQYSVVVDPRRLRAFDIPLTKIRDAIRDSNMDVGGRVVELAETEFMVRGRGYLRGIADIEQIVLKAEGGTPVLLKDVARVELAPDERRGVTELNGEGEVVSGIAVQRYGQNALSVIANVKDRLAEIKGSLPEGTTIVPVYDRSDLIHRAIATLKTHADRGERHRRARLLRVPAACAQRARRHHHAAARHPDRLHLHARARALVQHHEPRRHRHRHRRHDRCGDRHDRERAQASGARAARTSRAPRS